MDSSRQKLVIDTDCGIDDALALMLALTETEKAEVQAITCCFGNTTVDQACLNVFRVLNVCEKTEIPVYRGCAGALKQRKDVITVHGSDGLGNCADEFSTGDLQVSPGPASAALISLANKYPKEITLLAIGPLTNLAIAHRMDENFTNNLKSIVIMGGNYRGIGNVTEVAEFNFFCDPDSANIILNEALCPVTIVPWETTMAYGISWDLYKELGEIKTKKGEFFKIVTKIQAGLDYEGYIDCDFFAAAVALYPECIKSDEKHFLAVEDRGEYTNGLTILQRDPIDDSSLRMKARIITGLHNEILDNLRRKMLQNV